MADDKKGLSRRDFLKTTGVATGTLIGGSLIGGLVGYNIKGGKKGQQSFEKNMEEVTTPKGLTFFTNANEFNVIAQATERIFLEDDLGPGAIDLDVPFYIDN